MIYKETQNRTSNRARLGQDLQNGRSFSRGSDFDFSDQNTESETHVPPSISFREKHHFERDGQTDTRTNIEI